jgi:hypothetical protein
VPALDFFDDVFPPGSAIFRTENHHLDRRSQISEFQLA